MGTLTLQSESLGHIAGNAIVQKALEEVKKYETIPDKNERFSLLNGATQISNALSEGFKLVRAASLVLIEEIWDDLDFETRRQYDFQFRLLAEKRCPDLTWTTIQNHMRAARTYVFGDIHPPVIDGKIIEFNPLETPISKLVLARSAVESGKIDNNPKLWQILANPNSDVADLRKELFSDNSQKAGIDPEITYDMIGPYLIAKSNGDESVLAEFNFEQYYEGNDLARQAIDRILKFLGVTLDEEIIYQHNKKAFKKNETKDQ